MGALVTSEQIAEPKTHLNGGLPKSAPKGKSVGNCEEEEQETSQNVLLGTIDLGYLEVLSDTVTPKKTAKSLLSLLLG